MKVFVCIIIVALNLAYCSVCLAGEKSFKINNSLSDMNISSEVEDYEAKINHLVDDIDADGVIFIGGKNTKINSINQDGKAEFILTDVKIKLKKSIIDKYQNEFSTMTSKLIWDQVMNNLLTNMGERRVYGWQDPFLFGSWGYRDLSLFTFNLNLKDKDKNILTYWKFGANGILPLNFFLEKSSLMSKTLNLSHLYPGMNDKFGIFRTGTRDEDGNLFLYAGDISFTLPISQIKKIDHVEFSTVRNPHKN